MVEILLIRHGATKGNLEKRYIGITDEELSDTGIESLSKKNFEDVERIFSSPLKRCLETSNIIFKNKYIEVIKDLRECDFGEFENKNYIELSGNKKYEEWIKSNGTINFPKGENILDFKTRCINAFNYILDIINRDNNKKVAIICHGGTIMSILEKYAVQKGDYYSYQVKNASGYKIKLNENNINEGIKIIGKI